MSVEDLYVPAPYFQSLKYYPSCVAVAARDLLVDILSHVSAPQIKRNKVVLLKRGTGITRDGKCHSMRCMKNFHELYTTISERLRPKEAYHVVVFPPQGLSVEETVSLFRSKITQDIDQGARTSTSFQHNTTMLTSLVDFCLHFSPLGGTQVLLLSLVSTAVASRTPCTVKLAHILSIWDHLVRQTLDRIGTERSVPSLD